MLGAAARWRATEQRATWAPMDLQLTVPAVLFPAISLLYLSYNGRFLALAQLIRDLHAKWQEDGDEAPLALGDISAPNCTELIVMSPGTRT